MVLGKPRPSGKEFKAGIRGMVLAINKFLSKHHGNLEVAEVNVLRALKKQLNTRSKEIE